MKHIVIVGGGYAGATAAHWIARFGHRVEVTLVNERAEFSERIRLHQVAAGATLRPLGFHRTPNTRVVVGRAEQIDPPNRTVRLADGTVLGYDVLIMAVGSAARPPLSEAAAPLHTVASHDPAHRLRGSIAGLDPGAPVSVIGAGLTGLELATELTARGNRVRVLDSGPFATWLHPRARHRLRTLLPELGVEVIHTSVLATTAGAVLTDTGELPSSLTVLAGGFAPPALLADCGPLNERGQLIVDRGLRVPDHPEILVAGDAAGAVDDSARPLRMSCQTAVPMGAHAARNALRMIHGRTLRPFSMRYVWINLALGPGNGLSQFTRSDDSPLPVHLSGSASARFKEVVTRGAAWTAVGGGGGSERLR